jgi:Leucine-rich repeat (LRR) protein
MQDVNHNDFLQGLLLTFIVVSDDPADPADSRRQLWTSLSLLCTLFLCQNLIQNSAFLYSTILYNNSFYYVVLQLISKPNTETEQSMNIFAQNCHFQLG